MNLFQLKVQERTVCESTPGEDVFDGSKYQRLFSSLSYTL